MKNLSGIEWLDFLLIVFGSLLEINGIELNLD